MLSNILKSKNFITIKKFDTNRVENYWAANIQNEINHQSSNNKMIKTTKYKSKMQYYLCMIKKNTASKNITYTCPKIIK